MRLASVLDHLESAHVIDDETNLRRRRDSHDTHRNTVTQPTHIVCVDKAAERFGDAASDTQRCVAHDGAVGGGPSGRLKRVVRVEACFVRVIVEENRALGRVVEFAEDLE